MLSWQYVGSLEDIKFSICDVKDDIDESGISLEIINFLVVPSFLSVMHIKALNRFANKVFVFEIKRREYQFWFIYFNSLLYQYGFDLFVSLNSLNYKWLKFRYILLTLNYHDILYHMHDIVIYHECLSISGMKWTP